MKLPAGARTTADFAAALFKMFTDYPRGMMSGQQFEALLATCKDWFARYTRFGKQVDCQTQQSPIKSMSIYQRILNF